MPFALTNGQRRHMDKVVHRHGKIHTHTHTQRERKSQGNTIHPGNENEIIFLPFTGMGRWWQGGGTESIMLGEMNQSKKDNTL